MRGITILLTLITGLVTFSAPQIIAETKVASAATTSPGDDVRSTIDQVVEIVEALPGKENASQRRTKMREVINPRFDFAEMAKRCLGAHWKEITPEEQEEFVRLFSDLLAKTYLSKIDNVKRGMVRIKNQEVNYPKALVETIVTHEGDEFPINYHLLNKEGSWRVFDVIVENIGLISNYRNEFSGIIRRDTFQGLLQKLREKKEA